jgi:hypothetical protein
MDKPLLRSTLKKLRALALDASNHHNVMMAPQEILDFLALRDGIKPVFLLGRGFDDPKWIEGAIAIARNAGLHVVEGPVWDAGTQDETLPEWFRKHLNGAQQGQIVFYICRTRNTADEAEKSFQNPPISMEKEARLLGYPPCCVQAHYERDRLLDRTFHKILERTANGDVAEMKRLLREAVEVKAETPEEQVAFEQATQFTPAPYTSFHECPACATNEASPAAQLSKKYEALARAVDQNFASEVARNQEGIGR